MIKFLSLKLLIILMISLTGLNAADEMIESCENSVYIERKYLQEDLVSYDVQKLPLPEIWSEALPPFGKLSYWTRADGLKDLKLSLDFLSTSNKSLKRQVVDLPNFKGTWSPASTSMKGFEADLDLQQPITEFIKKYPRGILQIKVTGPKETLCQSEIRLYREDP